ncbi:flagellar hook-associated protein FlgK [Clostridium sp. 'deep sea']|uniref:flagellar hook-associated protein FlgK n=1 Tax=Clostridium sp. 'deep sea' TaxID=2779445 RepID=UPI00189686B6|nr:flagellar hook-associated protein FlgK [Clostridium sp. 'deep sea']QOR35363.1 flagellar hook-associated protein FlgK [Clostridium sp. 'deep sea']
MSFYSLNIARTGLFASQKNMDVTAHNIANADTEGFTRQRVEQSAITGVSDGVASVGGGVNIDKLTQIRNKYLDAQYRFENSESNTLQTKHQSLEYIEGVMSEPSKHGLNQSFMDLFKSIENLSNGAYDQSNREIVVLNAVKLCDTFRTISNNVLTYQGEVDHNIELMVDEVNMYAEEIAGLNKTIFAYENHGQKANDLRDKRNLLVDKLSALVPVQTKETENGEFIVKINGVSLVENETTEKIELRPGSTTNPFTGDAVREVYWQGSSSNVNITGGKIKGLLDIRDGNSKDNQGIPFYLNEIDTLAKKAIDNFNTVNRAGYTIPIGGNPSRTGVDFFNSDAANYSAFTIRVSDDLLASGFNIAASKTLIVGDTNWGSSENIVEFDKMRNSSNIEEQLQGVISDIAMNTNYYKNRSKSQLTLANHIENQKLAVSEVSIDEESVNLVQFQHSYGASAKMISVIDEMITTLINLK